MGSVQVGQDLLLLSSQAKQTRPIVDGLEYIYTNPFQTQFHIGLESTYNYIQSIHIIERKCVILTLSTKNDVTLTLSSFTCENVIARKQSLSF